MKNEVVEFELVRTSEMTADGLIKTLTNKEFAFFVCQNRLHRSI